MREENCLKQEVESLRILEEDSSREEDEDSSREEEGDSKKYMEEELESRISHSVTEEFLSTTQQVTVNLILEG